MDRLRTEGLPRPQTITGRLPSPKVSKHELLLGLVKSFVNTTLAGSVAPFVAYLSESGPVSSKNSGSSRNWFVISNRIAKVVANERRDNLLDIWARRWC